MYHHPLTGNPQNDRSRIEWQEYSKSEDNLGVSNMQMHCTVVSGLTDLILISEMKHNLQNWIKIWI